MKQILLFSLLLSLSFQATDIQAQRRKRKSKKHYLSSTKSPEQIKKITIKVEKVYHMFLGHFSNKAQADTTSNGLFKEQEMISVPIWQERKGEYWMYMSWYPANSISNPMAQLIYKIRKHARDTFLLERYNVPANMRGNIWAYPKKLKQFKPSDLHESDCVNFLIYRNDNEFYSQSRNPDEYCPEAEGSPFAYIRTEGSLSAEEIVLFGSFFDKDKNLLFTQKPDGVYFKRLSKNTSKYIKELYGKKKKRKKNR